MNKKCINLMGYTQKNEESIKSIVFNTINNNSKNKDDNDEINYDKNKIRKFNYSALSLSQGGEKKKNNVIKITDKGRILRAEITPIMTESRKNYLKDITQDEMYTCIKGLNKIQENLELER